MPVSDRAPATPVPAITDAMRPFFAAARDHRLVVQRCVACGTLRFPAREICTQCVSRDVEWAPVAGRGTVFSYSIVHQVYDPGFASLVPYAVVIVELEEGVRLVSNLVDCRPADIRIGMPVEVVFEVLTPEVTLPKFRPTRGPR
jgi:uncharacterized OB-fold protein